MDEGLSHYVLFLQHALQQQKSNPHTVASHSQRQMLILLVRLLTERYGETLKIDKRSASIQFILLPSIDTQILWR